VLALERQQRAEDRTAYVRQVAETDLHLTSLHRAEFAPAAEPHLAPPAATNVAALTSQLQAKAISAVPWWQLRVRRDARRSAAWTGPGLAAEMDNKAAAEHQQLVAQSAERWTRLLANDPETVLEELEAAFADNESPAAAVSCRGDQVDVVVLFPDINLVPEVKPAMTPGGKPTVKPRTKTERNAIYAYARGGTVLATVKEGFAVAPAIKEISIAVVRRSGAVPTGVLYVGRFGRPHVETIQWTEHLDVVAELINAPDCVFTRTGSTSEIQVIDLDQHPELAELHDAVRQALT
jgi:hypothetical protein